jgi:nitrogen fixation NifU-like protein
MSDTLYRDVLKEHMRHPKFSGKVDPADLRASAHNPLCGDELELTIALEPNSERIRAARTQARGCSVCVASASLMGEAIQGLTLGEASHLSRAFHTTMASGELPSAPPAFLPPLVPLRKHKSRIRCASLAWQALDDCVRQHSQPTAEEA